ERRRGRLLRRRLPYVAGDADSGDRVRVAERVGETAQGVERVGDLDDKRAVRDALDRSLYDGRARAAREGVRGEVVPVALVAQGIDRDPAERVHRGDRSEKLRLRPLEDDDDDHPRILRGDESGEGRDVRVVDVAAILARDLRGAGLPRDAVPLERRAVRDPV